MATKDKLVAQWEAVATKLLAGRTIKLVRYATDKELDMLGWDNRPVVLQLDNGMLLYPSQDDEGNGAGSLFTTDDKEPCLPVIRR